MGGRQNHTDLNSGWLSSPAPVPSGANPDAPVLLVAEGVRVVFERGWVGRGTKSRAVTVKATYYL